jgi:hypothetical protein
MSKQTRSRTGPGPEYFERTIAQLEGRAGAGGIGRREPSRRNYMTQDAYTAMIGGMVKPSRGLTEHVSKGYKGVRTVVSDVGGLTLGTGRMVGGLVGGLYNAGARVVKDGWNVASTVIPAVWNAGVTVHDRMRYMIDMRDDLADLQRGVAFAANGIPLPIALAMGRGPKRKDLPEFAAQYMANMNLLQTLLTQFSQGGQQPFGYGPNMGFNMGMSVPGVGFPGAGYMPGVGFPGAGSPFGGQAFFHPQYGWVSAGPNFPGARGPATGGPEGPTINIEAEPVGGAQPGGSQNPRHPDVSRGDASGRHEPVVDVNDSGRGVYVPGRFSARDFLANHRAGQTNAPVGNSSSQASATATSTSYGVSTPNVTRPKRARRASSGTSRKSTRNPLVVIYEPREVVINGGSSATVGFRQSADKGLDYQI